MTSKSIEDITDIVMRELKSRNTTKDGSVHSIAGPLDRVRELMGQPRDTESKKDLIQRVYRLQEETAKDKKELHRTNEQRIRIENEVTRLKQRSEDNQELKSEVTFLQRQRHEDKQEMKRLMKETNRLEALQSKTSGEWGDMVHMWAQRGYAIEKLEKERTTMQNELTRLQEVISYTIRRN